MEIFITMKIRYLLGISLCLYCLFFSIEQLYIESVVWDVSIQKVQTRDQI